MKVARRYKFVASHSLPGVPGYDKPHKHRYTVEVVVEGESQRGMILDTQAIDDTVGKVCATLEGTDLNDIAIPSTVEMLATWFYDHHADRFADSVTVWEDDDRWGQAP